MQSGERSGEDNSGNEQASGSGVEQAASGTDESSGEEESGSSGDESGSGANELGSGEISDQDGRNVSKMHDPEQQDSGYDKGPCPEELLTCDCEPGTNVLLTADSSGCLACGCIILSDPLPVRQAEGPPDMSTTNNPARNQLVAVGVPVGATALVVLTAAAIFMAYKRRLDERCRQPAGTTAALTWDDSGLQSLYDAAV